MATTIVDAPDMDNRSSSAAVSNASLLPNSSNPTSLHTQMSRKIKVEGRDAHLSFVTPSAKTITHGRTLIWSFSTSQGMFSTKTRKNRVL